MTGALHFKCQRCGCEVYRPESDHLDDRVCLNCRFGRPEVKPDIPVIEPEGGWPALNP